MLASLACKSKTHLTWEIRFLLLSTGFSVQPPCHPFPRAGEVCFWSDLQLKNDRIEVGAAENSPSPQLYPCASLQFLALIEEDWEGGKQGTQGCWRLYFWERLARSRACLLEEYKGISWSVYASSLPRRGWGKVWAGRFFIWASRLRRYSEYNCSFLLHKHLKWIYCCVSSTRCAFAQCVGHVWLLLVVIIWFLPTCMLEDHCCTFRLYIYFREAIIFLWC